MTSTPSDHAERSLPPVVPAGSWQRLPDGWEIAEYAGRGGRLYYAVYLNGRRMASGMPSAHSAARWTYLLAATT